MTYQTAFKKLKEKFENVDVSKLNDMAIQFTLSDEDCGGTFYAEAKDGKLSVEPYDYKDNDAVVDVTRAALTKILDGKLSVDKAIDDGDLTVKGDLEKIKNVADSIKKPEAPKAAKSEAKAEEKKCACAAKADSEQEEKKCGCTAKTEAKPAEKKCACAAKTDVKAEPEVKTDTKTAAKAPAAKAPAAKSSRTRKTAAKKATK